MAKNNKPKPKTKAAKKKEYKDKLAKTAKAKAKAKAKAMTETKTTESKHAVIHNTINNTIYEKKPTRRKPAKKATTAQTVSNNNQVHYPHNQLPRALDRSYNPDRFSEMYHQQMLPPSTYHSQYIKASPDLSERLVAPQQQQQPPALTEEQKNMAKQLSGTPTAPTTTSSPAPTTNEPAPKKT